MILHRFYPHIFLLILAWAFLEFSGCSVKDSPRCTTEYKMPNGVTCRWQNATTSGFQFGGCSDMKEYLNPETIEKVEVCR